MLKPIQQIKGSMDACYDPLLPICQKAYIEYYLQNHCFPSYTFQKISPLIFFKVPVILLLFQL